MARKPKKKWMQKAFSNAHGQLRATAKRKGLIKGDEPLSLSDVNALIREGGPLTRKRAQLVKNAMKRRKKR